MIVGCGSPVPMRARTGLGPVMACRVEDYRAAGGHAAVAGDVLDDFAVAGRFADAGKPVTNLCGGGDVAFRMYPRGVRSLVEGWTKSLAGGAARGGFGRMAGIAFWLVCSLGALTWSHGLPRPMSLLFYGLFAAQVLVQLRQIGTFGLVDALLYPVHVGVFLALLAASAWMTFVSHRARWRGRSVPIPSRREVARRTRTPTTGSAW
jgi:4,4'-diaponeurosporenoate glycosyltransferase